MAATGVNPITAREYLRVSKDSSGRERSPEEQHVDNARDAKAHGWTLGAPYRDLGSASRYARKDRDEFVQLVADLEAGSFNADVLMMWENSRGSRRVGEWVELIELLVTRQVQVHVTSHDRTYDPTLRRDWRALMDDAVRAEDEVRQTSERVRRAAAANAVAGKPHGKTPYGYKRNYTVIGRSKEIEQIIEPDEAAVVRELFDRFERTLSINAIARDFTERGIMTRTGLPWTPQHLRKLLRNPTYAGWRMHNGERFEAVWPKLINRRQFLAVQRILDDPARVTRRPGWGIHLLTGTVVCDVCGGGLRVLYVKPKSASVPIPMYVCKGTDDPADGTGHVKVLKHELEAIAVEMISAYMSRPDNYAAFTSRPDDGKLAEIAEQLAEARAEHDALANLSVKLAAKMEPALLARIAELERRDDELRTPSQLAGLLGPGDDIAARWAAVPLSTQRTIARLVFTPELGGQFRVRRSPSRGQRVPVIDRIEFRRVDA
jgi:DNA invertase Pin-like site-specific DNA recombinase